MNWIESNSKHLVSSFQAPSLQSTNIYTQTHTDICLYFAFILKYSSIYRMNIARGMVWSCECFIYNKKKKCCCEFSIGAKYNVFLYITKQQTNVIAVRTWVFHMHTYEISIYFVYIHEHWGGNEVRKRTGSFTAKFIDILWGSEDHIEHKSIFGVYVSTNYSLALLPHPSIQMVMCCCCRWRRCCCLPAKFHHHIQTCGREFSTSHHQRAHTHTLIYAITICACSIREMLTCVYSNNNNNCDVPPHIDIQSLMHTNKHINMSTCY